MKATSPPARLVEHVRLALLSRDAGSQSDAQLMETFIKCKDEAAFRSLVQRHGPMVLAVCRRLLRNHHDAEDAFQATFLVLVRKADWVRPREMVANWLHGVAYNIALKARAIGAKRQAREQQVSELHQHETERQDQDLRLDLKPVLDKELAHMPAKYRLPIVLCDLEGKSINEATHQLNWPQGTLAGRLARGRALLARRMARYGLSLPAGSLAAVLSQNAASASVSHTVVSATVQAAVAFTFNKTAIPGGVSPHVAMLAIGGLKSMSMTKLVAATAALFVMTLAGVGVGVSLSGNEPQTPARISTPPNKEAESESKTEQDRRQVVVLVADKNILQNSGIEEGEGSPVHWSQGAAVDGVEYTWDKNAGYKSKASLCLHKTANRYFPVAQWHQIVDRAGDDPKIRVSAQVKAEKATKAILDVIFLDDKEEWISHEWAAYIGAKNSGDPPANHDWTEYAGEVKIPKGAKKIQVGLQIYGPGKVWFDEVRAEYVK